MITVTDKSNGASHYIFDNAVSLSPDEFGIDTTAGFRIGHLTKETAAIYKNVTPPKDWEAQKYSFDGKSWVLFESNPYDAIKPDESADPTADEIKAMRPPVPQSITMRQARLALLNAGLLDDVEAAIITMDEAQRTQTQIEWEYAETVERDNALVAALGPKLGLDDAAIDSLFSMAATL